MQYTMLENGLDFVLFAIEHLKNAEDKKENNVSLEQELKYALLNLSSGIELVFKSRLFLGNWTYIFADMNKASKKKLASGDFISVDSNTLVERLENLCDYKFTDKQKRQLQDLRKARNKFEHYSIVSQHQAIESIINKALEVLVDFLCENYDEFDIPLSMDDTVTGMNTTEKDYIKKITYKIRLLKRQQKSAEKLASATAGAITCLEALVLCPECGEKFLRHGMDNGDKCECFYCGYQNEPENTAVQWLKQYLELTKENCQNNNCTYPLFTCFDCNKESMIYNRKTRRYYCFYCGVHYKDNEVNICKNCGMPYDTFINTGELCGKCQNIQKGQ